MAIRLQASLLVGLGVLLAACEPVEKVPLTGQVTLEYSGETSQEIFFNLDNGTHQELTLWGAGGGRAILPQRFSTGCVSTTNPDHSAFGGTIIDGPDWKIIHVPAGTRLRLSVSPVDFRQNYEDTRCRLQLDLENGGSIESTEYLLRGLANGKGD